MTIRVFEYKINMLIPSWSAPNHVKAFTMMKSDSIYQIPYPLRQVHQARVVQLPQTSEQPLEGDAAITQKPNVVCAIRTADCLPLLVSNQTGTEVAAIHAGWKGLVAGVIEATFQKMQSPASDCLVWIGPAICGQCFEVGKEVPEAFIAKSAQFASCFVPGKQHGKYLGDLNQIATLILQNLGVKAITCSQVCTIEDLRCDSYRREHGTDQRMITGIYFTPKN